MFARRHAALLATLLALAAGGGLAAGCGSSDVPTPAPSSVQPGRGFASNPTPITIRGDGFAVRTTQPSSGGAPVVDETYQAWLGSAPLQDVRRVDSQTLTATVPAGLTPGARTLRVQGPFGTSGELANAFLVQDTAGATLSVAIAAAPAAASVGQAVTVTLTVTNSGSADATNVAPDAPTVTGTGSATLATGPEPTSLASLAAGASGTFTWTYRASAAGALAFAGAARAVDTFSGTTITGTTDPAAPARVTVTTPAALAGSLPTSGSAAMGQEFAVVMTVHNTGGAPATTIVPALPSLSPAGLATLKGGTGPVPPSIPLLDGGASGTFTWTYVAGATPGNVQFSTSASGFEGNTGAALTTGTVTSGGYVIGNAGINATLTATPATASVGQAITVRLQVTNPGLAAVNAFRISATPATSSTDGARATCAVAPTPTPPTTLAAGQTLAFTWSCTPALTAGLSVGHLTFSVGASGTDSISGTPVQATSSAGATVNVPAALGAVLSLTRTPPAGTPFTVDVDQTFGASLAVTNSGGAAALAVTPSALASTPAAVICTGLTPASADVAAGATVVFAYSGCSIATAGSATLSASASGIDANNPSVVVASNTPTAAALVQVPASVTGALSIPSAIARGFPFTVRMTFTNAGGAAALVTPGPLAVAVGSTGTATYASGPTPATVTVPGGGSAFADFTYTATTVGSISFTGTAAGVDLNTGLATPEVVVTPSNVATIGAGGLSVSIVTAAATTAVGPSTTFTMTVTNTGSAAVNNVSPSLILSPAAGTLGAPTPTSIASLGTTAPGNTGTFTWTYTPTSTGYVSVNPASATGTDALSGGQVSASVVVSNILQVQASIGGTVTGLTGTGLVLRNNGAGDLAVTANGTYHFAALVPAGGAYAVTVATQPTGQLCTVTNPTGTVGTTNVTNVGVTCVNLYTVGGTITGLAGTGLQLASPGLPTQSPLSGAVSFSFGAVTPGTTYNVSVVAEPSTPTQTCLVANGSGTVVAANVTNIAVSCTTNTYALGGTVSGYTGSGLQLRYAVGATAITVPAGTTAISFGNLPSGTAYDVAVVTQPTNPTQVCTVTGGGTGTITNANVGNVAVTCTTSSYALGGTLTGYAGSGLQLRYAVGATAITVAPGATTFSFGSLPSGTTFDVAVVTQPTGPTQACTVTGGTGTITNAAVSSVQVTCATSSFTLGGSISGLAGSGLQLSSAGLTTQAPAAGATSYSFGSVASGTAYTITASAQPTGPSQTCSVANPSGTIGGANVTNANVTCTTNTYTIGGTLTGLTTGSIQLQNNGGNSLVLTADGTFTFTTPVASGGAYAVTIANSPPSLSCTVSGGGNGLGGGTVTNANVTNVGVTCTPIP